MASRVRRPIILPLSNPSSRSEAEPADLLAWTDGRALVATGSPFRPVPTPDGQVTIAQCNNAFVFPAMGLAAVAANATRVTDAMFLSAARALATCSPARKSPTAGLLPPVAELPKVADTVALAVAVQAVADGVAPRRSESELADRISESAGILAIENRRERGRALGWRGLDALGEDEFDVLQAAGSANRRRCRPWIPRRARDAAPDVEPLRQPGEDDGASPGS